MLHLIKQLDSRISWVRLILCFCLGSLVISPLLFIVGTSAPGIYGVDLENSSDFDESEFDDDFSVPAVVDLTIAALIFSRFRSITSFFSQLFYRQISLLPNNPNLKVPDFLHVKPLEVYLRVNGSKHFWASWNIRFEEAG